MMNAGRARSGWASLGAIAAFSWVWSASSALAESGEWNVHLDFGTGVPVVGRLGPPGDDGFNRLVTAGWVTADWQVARPWAAEVIVGVGGQAERSSSRGGAEYWQFGIGARLRLFDDINGFLDEADGNWFGNLWVSAHMGYHFLDNVQFGFDVGVGYEISLVRPLQVGLFTRALILFGGQRAEADIALISGVSFSVPLTGDATPPDADGDGLDDLLEAELGTNPLSADTDNDGLPDGLEVRSQTDPLERDTDNDGLDDGAEDRNHNGQLDPEETDPRRRDTDGGGVPDGDEVRDPVMDPRDPRDDDADQDGVGRSLDRCPDTPAGTSVGATGCPELGEGFTLEGVSFGSGSAELEAGSDAALRQALNVLLDNPEVRVYIEGHTDDEGRRGYNRRLSLRRAQAVRAWLVEHGIRRRRMRPRGYGETRPVADNGTEEGRAQNRRIEIVPR